MMKYLNKKKIKNGLGILALLLTIAGGLGLWWAPAGIKVISKVNEIVNILPAPESPHLAGEVKAEELVAPKKPCLECHDAPKIKPEDDDEY